MKEEEEGIKKTFKVIFIGDESVGKTAIINRFVKETFDEDTQSTVGADLLSKEVKLDNESVKICIWDTGGQKRYYDLLPIYFKSSKGCFIVYDISNKETFKNLGDRFEKVYKMAENGEEYEPNVKIILVGNKCDLEKDREVTKEEGQELANQMKCPFFETSARNDVNIDQIFECMAKEINESYDEDEKRKEAKAIKLDENPNKRIQDEAKAEYYTCI